MTIYLCINVFTGKRASATYGQTQHYLKPLFKKLRNKSIQDDILDSLTIIVGHLLNRNYVIANDAYLVCLILNIFILF